VDEVYCTKNEKQNHGAGPNTSPATEAAHWANLPLFFKGIPLFFEKLEADSMSLFGLDHFKGRIQS
jgi:hypothetical protein